MTFEKCLKKRAHCALPIGVGLRSKKNEDYSLNKKCRKLTNRKPINLKPRLSIIASSKPHQTNRRPPNQI